MGPCERGGPIFFFFKYSRGDVFFMRVKGGDGGVRSAAGPYPDA